MSPDKENQYDAQEHRHRFAAWAAARAAQQRLKGGTTRNLVAALERCGVKEFAFDPQGLAAFDRLHRKWCNRICSHLASLGVTGATYGHAAKLVNVYLKVMVVLPDPEGDAAHTIHPPLDRILLQNIERKLKDNGGKGPQIQTPWTKLDKKEYFRLIDLLRDLVGERPFWKIEEYWAVEGLSPPKDG